MFQINFFCLRGRLFHEIYLYGGKAGIDWTNYLGLTFYQLEELYCVFLFIPYISLSHNTCNATNAVPCNEITPKSVARRDAFCLLYSLTLLIVSLPFMITSPIANKSLILGTKSIIKVVLKYVRVQTCRGKIWNCLPQISTVAKHNIWPFPGPNVLNEKRL